ncbi:MAG: hypothetical protein A2V96_02920 [Candidatus Yonathbacteria bacterium RBG_16_43_6]|uniref:Uncharacterized protein n=2 Tax=Parcubacteria group TaxID=1794811 RepID=A0A1G2SDP7_9BACT|nr:MAG: hypothetical protein A2658_01095 [Candidatus Yonathbacteria bacterium RIFCSPHIGHO2_01_FULL_44_19]OHA80027.1 MAG: hypothetical protein A2V96_02920 [Candidatus Yonathbacteria bacterium RBG_16_43_6]OHA83187.1 MAG: hypothetical protein A3B07_00245 [Candidatus Yonathbacteria bacterium RIFCSPLOWO2_01_FULL_43_27]
MPFAYLVVIAVVLIIVSLSGPINSGSGRILKGCVFFFASLILTWLVGHGKAVGVLESRIVGEGSNYEIVATTLVPNVGTLVYAVDLDGNKEKADVLAEYPMKGYKVERVGKKTYLLPMNTIVTTDNKGETFFVSEDREIVSVPMALNAGGPVNPPLGGPGPD